MPFILQILKENPLLLLFLVCAIGYPLGRVRVRGASLGTASVLFVGIAVGAFDKELRLPDIVYLAGLTIFIYTIGLSSAPGFFAALNRKGLRDTGLAIAALTFPAVLAFIFAKLFHIEHSIASAMYSGAFTNASGLAGVLEAVKATGGPHPDLSAPVVGYSLAYPVGIVGPMIVMLIMKKVFRVNLAEEAMTIPAFRRSQQKLVVRTIEVTHAEVVGKTISELARAELKDIVFGRIIRDGHAMLAHGGLDFQMGDLVVATGPSGELNRLTELLGQAGDDETHRDRSEFDVRRIFVSKPNIVGRPLSELDLPSKYDAIVTRVRRGDVDLVPTGSTRLELGDRVRVLTRRENMPAITALFGDSYRALSEIDFLSISLGIALGLVLGLIPIPLPGGITFRLGFAGGPLVVALIVGKLGRTGPILWTLPYSASLTLRQLGLLLFAAGIGTRAGYDFYHTLSQGRGIEVFVSGAIMTFTAGVFFFVLGYKWLKVPMNQLFGIYAGAQTQPVVLSFAADQTKNDLPNNGYATIFPVGTIYKILMAQILFSLLK